MAESLGEHPGYVYILINAAFPEFIKIGLTTLDPKVRAKQLSTGTGIPAPFAVAWKTYVSDCSLVEQKVHAKLDELRVRSNREFFRLSVEEAIAVITEIALHYACEKAATEAVPQADSIIEKPEVPAAKQEPKTKNVDQPGDDELKEEITFLSVETHTAEQMAPHLKPEKMIVLSKLREVVLKVCPDCLWRIRGDGKITFTPLPHKNRGRLRNIMTVHLQDNPVKYRIDQDVVKFVQADAPVIEEKLRALFIKRS